MGGGGGGAGPPIFKVGRDPPPLQQCIGVNRPELGGTIPNLYATSRMILLHSRLCSTFQLEFTSDIQTFACSIRIVLLFFFVFFPLFA